MFEHHPAADLFPMMTASEFEQLKTDISEHGIREPAWTFNGTILDGRNRARACDELGMVLPTREYTGADPFKFVVSLNLHRRHLSESLRSLVAARIANLTRGGDRKSDEFKVPNGTLKNPDAPKVAAPVSPAITQADAAKMLNVSERTVKRAKQVLASGDTDLIAAVEAEQKTVNAAVTELRRRENAEQRAEIAKLDPGSPDKRYNVIVIDPPWPMQKIEREVRPNQTGLDYPTMELDEIASLEIPAATDCHMWLWTTQKFLPDALRILDQWGFRYVCAFVWHKPGGPQPLNLPQYNCEFALYARRGAPEFVDTKAFFTCFNAPRGAHSEKPEEFYEFVRRVTDGARIDMFNRREIEGFDTWGQQRARLAG